MLGKINITNCNKFFKGICYKKLFYNNKLSYDIFYYSQNKSFLKVKLQYNTNKANTYIQSKVSKRTYFSFGVAQ